MSQRTASLRLASLATSSLVVMTSLSVLTPAVTAHAGVTAAAGHGAASAVRASGPIGPKPTPATHTGAVPRPAVSGGRIHGLSLPAPATAPPSVTAAAGARVVGSKASVAPPSVTLPAHASVSGPATAVNAGLRAGFWNGSRQATNPAMSAPAFHLAPLAVPAGSRNTKPSFPSAFGPPTQVDNYAGCSSFGANEPTTAQSSVNPNLIVVGFQAYQDSGTCGDSHAFAAVSTDAGLHYSSVELPNLQDPASGDPVVAYDAVHQVFVYAFIEFTRDGAGNPIAPGRLGVKVSADGVNWGLDATLAVTTNTDFIDKPGIASDMNPSSPHYGRVAVTWTDFGPSGQVFFNAYTDNGGNNWGFAGQSINFNNDNCGNGTSPSFDANGDLMVAWWNCNNGTSIQEELSTDGGASWTASSDTTITGINDVGTSGTCLLNNGGTAFRCSSFPSLGGDPNVNDEGGQAFIVNWASADSTTQNGVTATISQIRSLTSLNGGGAWGTSAYMNFANFGDKFFPAISFAPDGRLNMTYSNRADDPGAINGSNPNGFLYDQWNTEASSLASLVANAYITYQTDGTQQNAGSRTFLGDYSYSTSRDNNFDTIPVYTAANGSFNNVLTQDLCFSDCFTALAPYSPVAGGSGSPFDDRYQFNTNPLVGSGNGYWNAVGLRSGTDGTTVDDDAYLYGDRYYSSLLAASSFSPPTNDYLLENDNSGHAASGPYYPLIHGFNPGPYTVEWAAGHLILSNGFGIGDGMGAGSVIRVYNSLLGSGTTYFVGLRPAAGNTSVYSLTLHSASLGNQQGRGSAVADTGSIPAGQPGFVSYATGGDPTQYDGIVVVNNNSGSGSYTAYLDSSLPSGSLNINAGAIYTNTTAVTLNLSASNPNPSDPVMDMRFSNDGVNFGSWLPVAASMAYTLPGGDGSHTVFVEYRNGAGAVSTPASHSITLDTVAPATTAALTGTATGCGTYFSPVQVTLNATDATSGVATTVYQLDGGAVTTYAGPFNVITAGGNTVTYHSTDHAGNVETTQTTTFSIQNPMVLDSPTSGPVGTAVAVTGTGFKSGETVKLYWDSTANPALASTVASGACAIAATIHVPAATHGNHLIIAKGVTSGVTASIGFAVIQNLILSAGSGHTGAVVAATGTGYTAGQLITLYWATNPGPVLTSTHANASGGFSVNITVPVSPAGTYHVYGVGSGPTLVASATFLVTPAIVLSPASGHAHATVHVSGTGFRAHQTITIRWNCSNPACTGTVLATVTASANGTFSATVHIPSAALGTYPIGAKDTAGDFAKANFKVT